MNNRKNSKKPAIVAFIVGALTIDIWDNGGRTMDRYALVPQQRSWARKHGVNPAPNGEVAALSLSHNPEHEKGIKRITRLRATELGQRVNFSDLPANVQEFIKGFSPIVDHLPSEVEAKPITEVIVQRRGSVSSTVEASAKVNVEQKLDSGWHPLGRRHRR